MLSILIPIYNFDVTKTVKELHYQATKLNIVFEIILVDDFSNFYKESNSILKSLANVYYYELEKNIGRSKIRNYLVTLSKYENIIFLDCDSKIINPNFISEYLKNKENQIICGGTKYSDNPPQDNSYYLHWYYGKNKEALSLKSRRLNPNRSFKTNNFFIKKNTFNKILFNENITKYGHEDTLFGYELEKIDIKISHIDNSVEHLGLDTCVEFLKKTDLSIQNLLDLYYSKHFTIDFFKNIKLLKYFFILKKYYLCLPLMVLYKLFNNLLFKNLCGKNPKLFLFNFYKLCKIYEFSKGSF